MGTAGNHVAVSGEAAFVSSFRHKGKGIVPTANNTNFTPRRGEVFYWQSNGVDRLFYQYFSQ